MTHDYTQLVYRHCMIRELDWDPLCVLTSVTIRTTTTWVVSARLKSWLASDVQDRYPAKIALPSITEFVDARPMTKRRPFQHRCYHNWKSPLAMPIVSLISPTPATKRPAAKFTAADLSLRLSRPRTHRKLRLEFVLRTSLRPAFETGRALGNNGALLRWNCWVNMA